MVEIGVFGGSFDPPHLGHLNVARDALEHLDLDRVLFVPAHRSPFKTGEVLTDPDLRRRLCEAAVADDPAFGVWDGELRRPPPSWTVDTLEALQDPERRLTLLMGQDQWAEFHRWKAPRRILELARVAVLDRGGYDGPEGPPDGDWPCNRVPVRRLEISSTEIRERVRAGRSIRYLVPDAVGALIDKNSLYGEPAADLAGGLRRSS